MLSVHFNLHFLCAEHNTLQWVSVIHQLNRCPFVSAWEKGPPLTFYAWTALEQCHKGVCMLEDRHHLGRKVEAVLCVLHLCEELQLGKPCEA